MLTKTTCLTLIVLMLIGTLLSGCSLTTTPQEGQTPVDSELVSPTALLTATATSAPTTTPTPTSTPIQFPHLPTPESTHALTNVIVDDFFFGTSSSDCELPCWQGLIVGKSNSEDVFESFDRVFNFEGLSYIDVENSAVFPGYIDLSHRWEYIIDERSVQSFIAWALINPDTNTLELLRFSLSLSQINIPYAAFHPDLSMMQIVGELGQPDYWEMGLESGGQGEGIHIRLNSFMVYDSGMSFHHSGELPAKFVTDNNSTFLTAQFCLDDNLGVAADISRPLVNGVTPLIEERINRIEKQLHPLNEMIGIDSEKLVNRIQTESNPCIELKVLE